MNRYTYEFQKQYRENRIRQAEQHRLGCSRLKTHQDMVDCSWYI
jgi:hypothetical protein